MPAETIDTSKMIIRDAVETDTVLAFDKLGNMFKARLPTSAALPDVPVDALVINDQPSLAVVAGQDLLVTLGPKQNNGKTVSYTVTGSGAASLTMIDSNTGTFNTSTVAAQVINVAGDDGSGGTDTAVIAIDVTAVVVNPPANTAPVVSDQTLTVEENKNLSITLGSLTDADGDSIAYSLAGSGAANYTIATANTGTFNSATVGTESLTVSADDGNGGTDTATITITVTAAVANPAPVVPDKTVNISTITDEVILLGPASTGGGETITYSVTGSSAFIAGPASNEITYNAPIAGTETLTVTGTAPIGGSDQGTITVIAAVAVAGIHTKIAFNGWSTMQNTLDGQNTESSTNPSANHDPSLYKLVGQMYAANGIADYVDDFSFLPQGSEHVNGVEAKENINSTASTVAVLSAYGSAAGIIMEPAQANEVPTTGNNGWIDRMVDIAETAEARNIIPIMFQCWGSAGLEADYDHAKINTDALQAKHGMLVVRSAEIERALSIVNPAYTTNTANAGGKYVSPVTHLFNGGDGSDSFHGSYAMQYLSALATFKCLTGISAADNAFVIPSGGNAGTQYGMSAQFISDIKTQVDLIQVESMVTGLAPGAAPIANNFARNGSHAVGGMVNVTAASNLRDDLEINPSNLVIKAITTAHFTAQSLANGVFSYTPSSGFTGDSSVVFTYTDVDNQAIDITLTLTIGAAPVVAPQEIIIGFGVGNTSSFTGDGNLYNHSTAAGGEVINLIKAFNSLATQGDLQATDGIGIGSVQTLTSGNLTGAGYRANDEANTVTYGPYPELYEGLSTAPKGSTVSFKIAGLLAGINYRVNLAGMVPFRAFTNVVSVDVNGVQGSYDCDPANVTEYEKVVKADSSGALIFTIASDGTSGADRWGLSYVHINKITDGTAADTPAAPVFIQQPQAANVTQGQAATFTAAASNAPSYQWYRDGQIINGITAPSYTVTTQAGDSGAVFTVVATNAGGSTTSNGATLTLLTSVPSITAQPATTLTVMAGDLISLSVTAAGATSYQWKKDGVDIAGQTSSSLSIASVIADGGAVITVDCINAFGTVTSAGSTLTVTAAKDQYWFSMGRTDGHGSDFGAGWPTIVAGVKTEGGNGEDINFIRSLPDAAATVQNVIRNTSGTVTDLKLTYEGIGTDANKIAGWGTVSADAIAHQNVIDKLTAANVYSHPNLWAHNVYMPANSSSKFEFSEGGLVVGETWKIQVIGIHYEDEARPVDVVVNGGTAGNMNAGAWADFDVLDMNAVVDSGGKLALTITPQVNATICAIRLIKV